MLPDNTSNIPLILPIEFSYIAITDAFINKITIETTVIIKIVKYIY